MVVKSKDSNYMENNKQSIATTVILEGAGTMSPRRSPVRSRSILSRNQSFCPGESGGTSGSLIFRHGNGASSPSIRAAHCESLSKNTGYTSLSELVPSVPSTSYLRSESFGANSPRTPMRDALVETAARAYLQPSESFRSRSRRSGWRMCLFSNNFFSRVFTTFCSAIPNPIQFFCCALQWIGLYFTGTGLHSSWRWDHSWSQSSSL